MTGDQMALDPGTDLCSTLRRTYGQFERGPQVVAQAIDLGLGEERAKEVLRALQSRIDHDTLSEEDWEVLAAIVTTAIGAAHPLAEKFRKFVKRVK